MDIQWVQVLSSGAAGAVFAGLMTVSQQKIINRRKTLFMFDEYYHGMIDSLVAVTNAASFIAGKRRPSWPPDEEKAAEEKLHEAINMFREKVAGPVLPLSHSLDLDFDWSKNIKDYFNATLLLGRDYVDRIDKIISDDPTDRRTKLSFATLNFNEVNQLIGHKYSVSMAFLKLQMNIWWILFPTFSLNWEIFKERAIGCPVGKWLLHESPPPLQKENPICSIIMGRRGL